MFSIRFYVYPSKVIEYAGTGGVIGCEVNAFIDWFFIIFHFDAGKTFTHDVYFLAFEGAELEFLGLVRDGRIRCDGWISKEERNDTICSNQKGENKIQWKLKKLSGKTFDFSSCLLIYWRTYMKEGKIVWIIFRQDIGNLSCIGLLWRPDDQTMIAVNIRQFLSFKMCFSTRPGKHKYKEFSYNIKSPS